MMSRFDGFYDACSNTVTGFFKKNYPVILAGFLAGVYVNGFDITNTILSIDKERWWVFNDSGNLWLILERWGLFLLHKIIPAPYQFVGQITGLLFMSIAGALIVQKYNKASSMGGGIFCILFTSSTIFLSMETFSNQIAYYSIAIFLAVVSYELFDKALKSKKYILLLPSFVCLLIAIGSYQSLFSIFATVFSINLFMEYSDNNINIKDIIKRTILVILFICIAILGNYLVVKCLAIPKNTYIDNYFHWSKYSLLHNFKNTLVQIYRSLVGIHQYPALNIIAIPALLASCFHILKIKRQPFYKTIIELLLLTIIFITSTHSVIIALGGGYVPLRILSSISIFLAASIFIYYTLSYKIEKLLITVIVIFSVFYSGSVATKKYMAGYYTLESDKTLATLVLSRVYDVAPGFHTGQTPIAFIGSHDYKTRNPLRIQTDEVMGGSFWQWDGGQPARMIKFMGIVSGVPMEAQLALGEQYQKAKEYSKNMPAWPDKGSVKLHDGVVIVKFAGGIN